YYIGFDHFNPYWNYIAKVTYSAGDSRVFNVTGFQQNYNGWHTLNFEVVDSVIRFYYDGQVKASETFPGLQKEKFLLYGLTSRADRNLMPQIDYVKCYDRNGKLFYFEDFNDCSVPSVFAKYIECPKQPCTTAFTNYYNQQKQTTYTWSQLDSLYE